MDVRCRERSERLTYGPRCVPTFPPSTNRTRIFFFVVAEGGVRDRFSSRSWTKRQDYLWPGRASSVGPRFRQRGVFGSVPNPLSISLPPRVPLPPCILPGSPPAGATPSERSDRRPFTLPLVARTAFSTGWTWAASRARLGGTSPLGPRWSRPRGAQESPESSATPPITGVTTPTQDQPPITPQPPHITLTVSVIILFFFSAALQVRFVNGLRIFMRIFHSVTKRPYRGEYLQKTTDYQVVGKVSFFRKRAFYNANPSVWNVAVFLSSWFEKIIRKENICS